MTDVRDAALAAHDTGLCVLPPLQDGSKAPIEPWTRYQSTPTTREQVEEWYANPRLTGVGFVCGRVSGGLELFEFEGRAVNAGIPDRFVDLAEALGHADLVNHVFAGYLESSPSGGIHLLYYCDETGCVKLAKNSEGKDLIETKGEGGYAICAPSNGKVHPTGGAWKLIRGGFDTIPRISPEQRRQLHEVARLFNECEQRQAPPPVVAPTSYSGESWVNAVIDDYNGHTTWAAVLAGRFEHLYDRNGIGYWHYHDAENKVSATTNAKGTDTLIVFSGTADGDGWRTYDGTRPAPSYDRFSAHVLIGTGQHDTQTRVEVARRLQAQGYGPPSRQEVEEATIAALLPEKPTVPPQPAGEAANGGPDDPPDDQDPCGSALLLWPSFWRRERTESDFVVDPVLARGRSHAVYAAPKVGKSLLLLEVAAACAAGRPVLNRAAGDPMNVLYLDMEMTEDDVFERLDDLGYSADDDLSHLYYYLLPKLPPLDTAEGGAVVERLVRLRKVDLVVIDTMGRAVEGPEDKADTFRSFYKHTGTALKRLGVTYVRLDHSGKDPTKGQRGSSAKADDVDVVWSVTKTDNGLRLRATHRRISWIPETVALRREIDPLRHVVAEGSYPAGTRDMADILDALGVPLDATTRTAGQAVRDAGGTVSNTIIGPALKLRRYKANAAASDALAGSDHVRSNDHATGRSMPRSKRPHAA